MQPSGRDLGKAVLDLLQRQVGFVVPKLRGQLLELRGPGTPAQLQALEPELTAFVRLFGGARCEALLYELEQGAGGRLSLVARDETVRVDDEEGVVAARKRAACLAVRLGFRPVLQTKVAAAASELARNILRYAGTGEIRLQVLRRPRPGLLVEAVDRGPGIPDLDAVLAPVGEALPCASGMGLRRVRALADEFAVHSAAGEGTCVSVAFRLPS